MVDISEYPDTICTIELMESKITAFKLWAPEGTCSFSKITQGRKWVGRVYPMGTGGYGARIGKSQAEATGATREEAFENAVAKFLGYESPAALREHNSEVREQNRVRRQHAEHVVHEMLRGNFEPLDRVFQTGDGLTDIVPAAERTLLKK
jgi:hypothetical protein